MYCFSSQIKFIIMDFEFTMIDRFDLLLVSGAICNSLEKYAPQKLEGTPLILTKDGKVRVFHKRRLKNVVSGVKRIFRTKPDLLRPLLGQLYRSVNLRGGTNLSTVYLNHYLHFDNRAPVLVFWNGSMDITIIERLKIKGIKKILNMTAYSETDDSSFSIKLIDVRNNKTIHISYIGEYNKKGRMLNLLEAHGLMCDMDHRITHCHDPVADVILTKCIFNVIINRFKPIRLYNLCRKK